MNAASSWARHYESLASCHFQSSQVSIRSISKLWCCCWRSCRRIFVVIPPCVFRCAFYFRATPILLFFLSSPFQNNKEVSQWINSEVVVVQGQQVMSKAAVHPLLWQFSNAIPECTEKVTKNNRRIFITD